MLRAFLFGSAAYPLLEVLYRRRTHPAMALAGGMSMCALLLIHRNANRLPLWGQALLGGGCILALEYGIGKLWNRKYQIWDYRKTPLNFQGQVCLPFFGLWCALSAAVLAWMGSGSFRPR